MSRVIWKYEFPVRDSITLMLPVGAEILHVDAQHGQINTGTLWALVSPTAVRERRRFVVRGTGHEHDDWMLLTHVGTWMAGAFVWHLFEGIPAASEEKQA